MVSDSVNHPLSIRVAGEADVDEIVGLTNKAYVVEQFCLVGDRINAADVRSCMAVGCYFVASDASDASSPSTLCGSVFTSISNGRGYLGTLAVDPLFQGRGIARALVAAVEDHCRQRGCGFLDITVVNLRQELFPFYTRLGFSPSAALPFPRPEKAVLPLHLVQMTKALRTPQDL